MSWIQLGLLLLQLVNKFIDWGKESRQMQAGEDKAIAAASLEVLKKTETGKRLTEKIEAMRDEEVDDLLGNLGRVGEPK